MKEAISKDFNCHYLNPFGFTPSVGTHSPVKKLKLQRASVGLTV
jgi:hypothetical protein